MTNLCEEEWCENGVMNHFDARYWLCVLVRMMPKPPKLFESVLDFLPCMVSAKKKKHRHDIRSRGFKPRAEFEGMEAMMD
jgi:hypothetical protein